MKDPNREVKSGKIQRTLTKIKVICNASVRDAEEEVNDTLLDFAEENFKIISVTQSTDKPRDYTFLIVYSYDIFITPQN